jgi:hypothetical protein
LAPERPVDPTFLEFSSDWHTDPAFTLRVYSHMMRRSPEERERLKALVEAEVWSYIGHKVADSASPATG